MFRRWNDHTAGCPAFHMRKPPTLHQPIRHHLHHHTTRNPHTEQLRSSHFVEDLLFHTTCQPTTVAPQTSPKMTSANLQFYQDFQASVAGAPPHSLSNLLREDLVRDSEDQS